MHLESAHRKVSSRKIDSDGLLAKVFMRCRWHSSPDAIVHRSSGIPVDDAMRIVLDKMLPNTHGVCEKCRAEGKIKISPEELERQKEVLEESPLTEGPRPLTQVIKIVVMDGADLEGVRSTIEHIREEIDGVQILTSEDPEEEGRGGPKPILFFDIVRESEISHELSEETAVVTFVANGTTKGAERLLKDLRATIEGRGIATFLVSEERQTPCPYDFGMTFEDAITRRKLVSGLRMAYYQRREADLLP